MEEEEEEDDDDDGGGFSRSDSMSPFSVPVCDG